MSSLGHVFSSQTRTEVLRALVWLRKPQGIRHLARLTRRGPRSVERALAALIDEERILRRETPQGHPGYLLDPLHPDYQRIIALFNTDRRMELRSRTTTLTQKASSVCDFMDEGLRLVAAGRKSLHASH